MDFSLLGPPVRYSQFPLIVERSLNHRRKIYFIFAIFGGILLFIIIILSHLIISKYFNQQKQTTTKEVEVRTTVSTTTIQMPIVSIYAQCSASNCPNSRTCCPNNKLATKMHCCEQNTPICCSPDQGWCCRIKTPVCCGKYNCCPLNTTCCTIRGIEDCCPVSVNTSITNELAIL
ncbi:unnamed protein product [Adineta ricciae]|uniref:Uncharacterized protein n=1 Tax=Adineta ricciae TaxID=249248 RepID=A0A815QG59_ADIRI|nr:unnamed protein product [Adineta ricciae]